MKRIVLVAGIILLVACSPEPGSEKWCEEKKNQPKSEWSGSDAATFARNCILESTTIGSEAWCKDLKKKPKGEWSANEAASYAKHCVM